MLDPAREPEVPRYAPGTMRKALREVPGAPAGACLQLGRMMQRREARHIYQRTWKTLRPLGFSRPLRLEPWPGVTLLLPFVRGRLAVIPQSFSPRVPERERALSLVGRSAASGICGYRMLTVLGTWDREVLELLEAGGCRACSLDMLEEAAGT